MFTGDTLFKDSVGGVKAPGPHHLHRPARLDHGHADGASARDRHLPGALRRDHGRAGVGLQRLHPRLARARPRGLRAVHRARRAGDARAARRRLRRRHEGVGALARRLRRHRAGLARRATAAAGARTRAAPARSMQAMARENEKIPTSRARRTATVATLAASEAVKQFGTRAANVDARRGGLRGGDGAAPARDRQADRRGARHDEGRRDEARAGDVVPGRRPRRRGAPRGVPARARQAARRGADGLLQADAPGDRGGPRRADRRGVRDLRRGADRGRLDRAGLPRDARRTAARWRSRSSTRASPARSARTCRTWT